MLEGAYGFCVMFKDHPGEIYCMRNASPLVASHTEDGSFIASDMVALLKYTNGKFIFTITQKIGNIKSKRAITADM